MWYVHDLFSLLQLYESERKDWPFFFISIIMNLMFNIIIINFKEKITTFKGPFDEIEEGVGSKSNKVKMTSIERTRLIIVYSKRL